MILSQEANGQRKTNYQCLFLLLCHCICPPELNKQQKEHTGRQRNREPEEWENRREEGQLSGEHREEKENKTDHCHKMHCTTVIKKIRIPAIRNKQDLFEATLKHSQRT